MMLSFASLLSQLTVKCGWQLSIEKASRWKAYFVLLVVSFLLRALAAIRFFRITVRYVPKAKPKISKKGLIVRCCLLRKVWTTHQYILILESSSLMHWRMRWLILMNACLSHEMWLLLIYFVRKRWWLIHADRNMADRNDMNGYDCSALSSFLNFF